ncbi:MAG: hypothetical protein RTU92_14670 [Candidatus Thorarchaeota archaeon]
MSSTDYKKFVIPVTLFLIVAVGLLIITGLASGLPDGFEWAFFEFSEVGEPESDFTGIWGFLGEGEMVDAFTSAIGIVIVLVLGILLFKAVSKKE